MKFIDFYYWENWVFKRKLLLLQIDYLSVETLYSVRAVAFFLRRAMMKSEVGSRIRLGKREGTWLKKSRSSPPFFVVRPDFFFVKKHFFFFTFFTRKWGRSPSWKKGKGWNYTLLACLFAAAVGGNPPQQQQRLSLNFLFLPPFF